MTYADYKRAHALVEQGARLNAALMSINKMNPELYFILDGGSVRVNLTDIIDTSLLQMLKTMLTSHLESKIAALNAEFKELGGAQNG